MGAHPRSFIYPEPFVGYSDSLAKPKTLLLALQGKLAGLLSHAPGLSTCRSCWSTSHTLIHLFLPTAIALIPTCQVRKLRPREVKGPGGGSILVLLVTRGASPDKHLRACGTEVVDHIRALPRSQPQHSEGLLPAPSSSWGWKARRGDCPCPRDPGPRLTTLETVLSTWVSHSPGGP